MVWYQMETFPTFIKLWGRISGTLVAGATYTIVVRNNYDVSQFDGHKYIYLSEVNTLGGTNIFLGVAFIVMASIVVLIMLIFVVLYCVKIRGTDIYSTDNLKW